MEVSTDVVAWTVVFVYALYFALAIVAVRAVWRATVNVAEHRRTVLRSLAIAALFAPALAGARLAPFLLAVLTWMVLDLTFVRPLTLAWLANGLEMFALKMLFPFFVTWVAAFGWMATARRAKQEK